MIIYKITNIINNKIYVGKDANDNPNYLGSGLWIIRAVKKYGKINFQKDTLEVCDGDNWEERERYWIAHLRATDPKIGYNIGKGGEGFGVGKDNPMFGKHHSKKSKQRLSERVRGQKNPMFGRTHTEKTRAKISQNLKGKMAGDKNPMYNIHLPGRFGKDNPMFGKHLSTARKRLISRVNSGKNNPMYGKFGPNHPKFGKKPSKVTKRKMALARTAWWVRKRAKNV